MPMVGMPDSSIVPPTITRLTLAWPNGSAWSRLLRMRMRKLGLSPLASMSASRFSRTVATMRVDQRVEVGVA